MPDGTGTLPLLDITRATRRSALPDRFMHANCGLTHALPDGLTRYPTHSGPVPALSPFLS